MPPLNLFSFCDLNTLTTWHQGLTFLSSQKDKIIPFRKTATLKKVCLSSHVLEFTFISYFTNCITKMYKVLHSLNETLCYYHVFCMSTLLNKQELSTSHQFFLVMTFCSLFISVHYYNYCHYFGGQIYINWRDKYLLNSHIYHILIFIISHY